MGVVRDIQDKLKEAEKGILKFEFREGTSHYRMKNTFIQTLADWDKSTRAALWQSKIRIDEALKRGPACTVDPHGPVIESVEPMVAPLRGMTPLRVRGIRFDKRAAVLLAGRPCRIVTRKSSPNRKDEIIALSIPCKAECTVPITVQNPDGTSFTLDGVTYINDDALTKEDMNILMGAPAAPSPQSSKHNPLSIASISPVTVPLRGGVVTIIGSGLTVQGTRVFVEKTPAKIVSVSESENKITVAVPPSPKDTRATVVVVNPNGEITACQDILFYTKLIEEEEEEEGENKEESKKESRKETPAPLPSTSSLPQQQQQSQHQEEPRRRVWGKKKSVTSSHTTLFNNTNK